MTPTINTIDINAGWSLFPVAQLPGTSTFEMSCTSGKFEADLFLMTNKKNKFETNTEYLAPWTEHITLADGATTFTLAKEVARDENDVALISIAGLELGTGAAALTAGQFFVDDADNKTVTFVADDLGEKVTVNYFYKETAEEINIDNKAAAIGEAILMYPVYGSGEDCTAAAVKGHVYLKVYRARVTGQPGLDGSYKTASTYQFTLSALDPKRPDDAVYSIAYVPTPEV